MFNTDDWITDRDNCKTVRILGIDDLGGYII